METTVKRLGEGREGVCSVAGVMVTRWAGADGEARSELTGRCSTLARPCVATMHALASLVGMGAVCTGQG
jgi:hypothetical protein